MKLKPKVTSALAELEPGPAILLCRPQLGENVGTVARAMLNFGLGDLRLVNPRFGWPNAKAVAASSGAADILDAMTIHKGLDDAAGDLHHTYVTTRRPRDMDKRVIDARTMAREARAHIADGRRVGLVFGPERTGLENEEIALADAIVTIPLNPAFASLNLAQAVLLCAYEWHLAGQREAAAVEPVPETFATKGEVAALMDHLMRELDASGFFKSEDRRHSLAITIETMFERRRLTRPEIDLLHGIIKELRRGPLGPRG